MWAKEQMSDFIMSNLSESLTLALLSWATWAICSLSLICPEQPEQFTHSRSFVLSDLINSLTVAYLIWAIWANERWANEQNPNPDKFQPWEPTPKIFEKVHFFRKSRKAPNTYIELLIFKIIIFYLKYFASRNVLKIYL